jgi:hypothetical protein
MAPGFHSLAKKHQSSFWGMILYSQGSFPNPKTLIFTLKNDYWRSKIIFQTPIINFITGKSNFAVKNQIWKKKVDFGTLRSIFGPHIFHHQS